MARRPSKHLRPPRPLLSGGAQRRVHRRGVSFIVKDVPADRAEKDYTCPGCHRRIDAGTAHVVAWPESLPHGLDAGVSARRHWHSHCWGRG